MNRKIQLNNYINKDKKIYNIRASDNNNLSQLKQFLIFSKSFNKDDDEINNENNLEKYNIKHMEKLEYEFELRRLKKKLGALKKENKEINEKLDKIKNKNENMEKDIIQNENEDILLNDIILLNKQYMANNSRVSTENEFNNQNNNDKFSLENVILNIMDLKFDYDNNLLINEFIDGVNNLLNLSLSNQFNDKNNQNINLLDKINQLIDLKNNLYNNINKYDYLIKENIKYNNYFTSLINNLNLNNIYELDEFIKQLYIKNIKENNHMQKITETLINESILSKPKNGIKNHFYSFNNLINSVNQTINNNDNDNDNDNDNMENYKLQNLLIYKNSDSRINQNKVDYYLINRARKLKNNIKKNSLNKAEHIDIIHSRSNNKNLSYQKNNNISLNYSEKYYSTYNNRNKKKKKININLFNQRNNNFNKYRDKININGNQNNLFNTEEDINDIKYYNINEDNKVNKQINNNYLDKKIYGHVKNHSVIIFNK